MLCSSLYGLININQVPMKSVFDYSVSLVGKSFFLCEMRQEKVLFSRDASNKSPADLRGKYVGGTANIIFSLFALC